MNIFFKDEIFKLKNDFKTLSNNTEFIPVSIGKDFGLGSYISAFSFNNVNAERKVVICSVDFFNEDDFDIEPVFKNYADAEFVFVEILGFEKGFPNGITALSERELYALCNYDSGFKIASAVYRFEKSLKKYSDKFDIKILRYTNILCSKFDASGFINSIFTDISENNRIELCSNDYQNNISITYIVDVIKDIFILVEKGLKGNVYNGSSVKCTVAELKNTLYKLTCSSGVDLELKKIECAEEINKVLSTRKIDSLFVAEHTTSLENILEKTIYDSEDEFITGYVKETYEGKISRIRAEEKDMLLEVDRICKKHNINYYLVGGSLLGAVRNNGFIPWDDDVDICMLREDFQKFRKICPEELSEKYAYQSYRNEKTTHYIYDKIRLKGTYFSSEHSGKYNDMENGVFLDIFVFDKTANSKMLQKLHVFLIVMFRRFIHIRWTKEAVSGKFAFVSKLLLPLVCVLPFSFYHYAFEFILRLFEKNRQSRFVLDGIGLYVKKGALPLSWVTENNPVSFEGEKLPGVKDSNSYLSMWYGENYMTPPELSKRMSGHVISRLDMGEYLFAMDISSDISLNFLSLKNLHSISSLSLGGSVFIACFILSLSSENITFSSGFLLKSLI